MTLEEALRSKLLSNSTLYALVGDNIFPNEARQGLEGNYIVYVMASLVPNYTASKLYDDIVIQFSCFSDLYTTARQIAELVRVELGKFSGTIEGVKIPMILFENQGVSERQTDSRKAHVSYDFRIFLNKE